MASRMDPPPTWTDEARNTETAYDAFTFVQKLINDHIRFKDQFPSTIVSLQALKRDVSAAMALSEMQSEIEDAKDES